MTNTFQDIINSYARKAAGENNDCSVIALSIACGVEYQQAQLALAKNGRKMGRGAFMHQIRDAALDLGAVLVNREIPSRGYRYTAKTIGTAFPKGTFLVVYSRHIAALVDGTIEDWTDGRRHRVQEVIEVRMPELKPEPVVEPQPEPVVDEKPAPTKKPRKPYNRDSVPGACAIVWELCYELLEELGEIPPRKLVMEKGVEAGVNAKTVSTQFWHWKKAQLEG